MPRSPIAPPHFQDRTASDIIPSPDREARPRRQRRKDARPGEIIAAATSLFAEKGFAATKLEDVAHTAGVAKGTVYVYFETKEDLFRAVARKTIASHFAAMRHADLDLDGPVSGALTRLLRLFVDLQAESSIPAMIRMVIAESHNFPDLARIWNDEVAAPSLDQLADLIARAQAKGEVRQGDPRLYAFSITGPMVTALLYRECFKSLDSFTLDVKTLGEQHLQTLLHGLLTDRSQECGGYSA